MLMLILADKKRSLVIEIKISTSYDRLGRLILANLRIDDFSLVG